MKAIILAGGLGSRLSEETVLKPKPLVEVGGKPILWHIMNIYATHGVTDLDIRGLLRFHQSHGRLATVTTVRSPARFGRIGFSGDQVIDFYEKPEASEGWINGGYFVLNARALDYVQGDETVWERGAVETLVRDGQLMGYRHAGFWSCMDTAKEKAMLEDLWKSGNPPWKVWDRKRPPVPLPETAGAGG